MGPAVVAKSYSRKSARLGEPGALVEQREDLALVARDQPRVGLLVEHRPAELHAVLLAEALDLAVAEHRQARQGREHRGDAEVLVALAELLDRGLLVRVAHEVDVALEDLRVELDGLLDRLPVAGRVLVPEHVHERAVVDAVHPQRPDEVALEQPERLGQQERARDLRGDPVDHLDARTRPASARRTPPSSARARHATGSRRLCRARATTVAGCASWRGPSRRRTG